MMKRLLIIFCGILFFQNTYSGKTRIGKDSLLTEFVFSRNKSKINILQLREGKKYYHYIADKKTEYLDSGTYEIKWKKVTFKSFGNGNYKASASGKTYFFNNKGLYRNFKDLLLNSGCLAKNVPYYGRPTNWLDEFKFDLTSKPNKSEVKAFENLKSTILKITSKYFNDYYKLISNYYCGPESYNTIVGGVQIEKNKDTSRLRALEDLNTIYHESTHSFNTTMQIYLIPQISLKYQKCNIFKSSEISRMISDENKKKIFRYKTYISGDPRLPSVQEGIFGIMDEFSAYQVGTTISVIAAERLIEEGKMDEAQILLKSAHATYFALYEFNLFIAWYLEYAYFNFPAIYKELHDNTNFRLAFTLNELIFNETNNRMIALSNKSKNLTENLSYYEKQYAEYPKKELQKHDEILKKFRVSGVNKENYFNFISKL
ncbi:MAG: hypothetical protein ACK5AY_11615 [Bacteroidota bacterium]|jgi:hypothetical protein